MADGNKKSLLKSSFGISAATLISRILGLLRVRLEAEVLGGGEIASGWFLAFKIPNLFRRLLGEGALGTALIPLIAQTEAESGTPKARRELAVIFATLSAILAVVVIVISGLALLGARWAASSSWEYLHTERVRLMFALLPLLMPYTLFICLIGIIGAVLNYAKVFFVPALGALSLNLFLIGGLAGAWYCGVSEPRLPQFLNLLALLVLLSGLVQLAGMLLLLKFYGKFPDLRRESFQDRSILGKLWKLALPAMIGNSALQISFLVDQFIASFVNARGVAALNYVDRIIDLPVGIYAVALGSVLMARMARSAATGNTAELTDELNYSLRHLFFLCIPIGLGIAFFHDLLLRLICLGGNYTEADLAAARMVAVFYGIGIPVFCGVKIILPAFYARKLMITPLRCSLLAIVVNIGLNFLFMKPLQQGGIALATVISSSLNAGLLLWSLHREGFAVRWKELRMTVCRTLLLSLLIFVPLFFACRHLVPSGGRLTETFSLLGIGVVFLAVYLPFSHLLGAGEVRELLEMFRRTKRA